MIVRRYGRLGRVVGGVVLVLCALAFASVPASAGVLRNLESSFTGADVPEGAFEVVYGNAADTSGGASDGDVYVSEFGVVDKFTAAGVYAGVRITGTETPQESFSILSFLSFRRSQIDVDSSAGVNEGDLYVADVEHGVIDRFDESGHFLCQIAGEATEARIKETVPTAKECDSVGSGLAGEVSPTGVAVDVSTGDLYVSDAESKVIDEFGPDGRYIAQITDPHLTEPGQLALDSLGDLYVINQAPILDSPSTDNVVKFHNGNFVSVIDESDEPESITVDPATNHFLEYDKKAREISEYNATGALLSRFHVGAEGEEDYAYQSLAVGSTDDLYAGGFFEGGHAHVDVFGPDLTFPNVTTGSVSGLTETSATLAGHVDPDVADGGGPITECMFEYVTQESYEAHEINREDAFEGATRAPCNPAPPYSAAQDVTAVVSLSPSTAYEFRLTAANANKVPGSGAPAQVVTEGPPVITQESSSTLSMHASTLEAVIGASGHEAHCTLQYVDATQFKASGYANATVVPCTPTAIPSAATNETVTAKIIGLSVNTTYHYRFVAVNSAGTTDGADQTFATFGIKSFAFEVLNKKGQPYTQAGGHPYEWVTSFALNTTGSFNNQQPVQAANANFRNVETELPPGLIANPNATARCPRYQVALDQCNPASQVGELIVEDAAGQKLEVGLYNVVPPNGVPLELGGVVANLVRVYIDGNVRTGGDYGATAKVTSASAQDNVTASIVRIWGAPEDPSHNLRRVCPEPGVQVPLGLKECPPAGPPVPLLTNPTSCPGTPLVASMRVDSWQEPGAFVSASTPIPAMTGCESLDFTPSVAIASDTTVADSPAGLNVYIEVPQNEAESGLASSALENTTVVLPAGVSVSPSAANGLEACSEAEIGLHDEAEAQCPNASKIGTVDIASPLLADHLTGGVYVARQGENPFGSLLAMYIAAEANGARVKLAGHIVADPVTGQLTTTFTETPQLPFSDFKLNLFGGRRGALATPETCGSPNTSVSLAPWDGLAATSFSEPFTTNTGCVSGFAPAFKAGTVSAQAGAYSPFTLSFSRSDSEEDLAGATVTLPQGLIGKIAGVAQCSDAQLAAAAAKSGVAEQASPSCPAASQVGTVQTTAGPGPSPVSVSGRAYLTGPYKGGPYGIAVVVPAVAGPFDLGTVVIRQALHIDPSDAHVTDISDPFPTILQGVPLRIKSVNVTLDRPSFTFNPTSCEAKSINATLKSTGGANAAVSSHFQAANCATLKFAPKFSVSTVGKASKANGASLDVKVGYPTGPAGTYANIKSVKVDLPKQLPARLTTLQKACVAATFEKNPADCPVASDVGTAVATTPVLDFPLTGPAYLVSHGGEAFPDLEIILQGEGVTLVLVGNTQIKNGITSSTFKTVPDTPVSSFELKLPTGPDSILSANVPESAKFSLCGEALTMPTTIVAQNGAQILQSTPITVEGCSTVLAFTAKIKKKTVTLSIYAPGTGQITANGKGLTSQAKTVKGQEHITIVLKQKKGERRKTTVKVAFTPSTGKDRKKQAKTAKLTFKK